MNLGLTCCPGMTYCGNSLWEGDVTLIGVPPPTQNANRAFALRALINLSKWRRPLKGQVRQDRFVQRDGNAVEYLNFLLKIALMMMKSAFNS